MPDTTHQRVPTPAADTRGPRATGNPWQPMAEAIRSLPRSMFAGRTPRALARGVVAQCAYAMVVDPSTSARAKDMAVTMLVRMLRSYERTRAQPGARSSRAPLSEPERSGTLDRVPLDVLLESLPSASQLAKRGGDAIKRAGPH